MPGASRQQATTSLGSGVIVSQDGFVLTNHVVQAAEAIEVALADGRKDSARWAPIRTRIWRCSLGSLRNLPTAVLAPDKGLRVGDVVLAIGNPFGVGQTTTQGIVSALGRNGLGLNTYEHFIQTDAAINPGNSGGALVDAQGSLVGINTAIYSESGGSMGIGFATPIDIARRVMDEIVKTGQVKRGWLGIERGHHARTGACVPARARRRRRDHRRCAARRPGGPRRPARGRHRAVGERQAHDQHQWPVG